jgi:RNA recognition motif-containing protein
MKLYVGNISSDVTEEDVRKAFEVYGKVASVSVDYHQSTGESLGFAFVEMPSDQEALAAMSALSQSSLKGRPIQVNQARTGPIDRRRPGRGGGRREDDPEPGGYRK